MSMLSPGTGNRQHRTMSAAEPTHSPHPFVVAHRGASADRPEHTRAAYELALREGADGVECDDGGAEARLAVAADEDAGHVFASTVVGQPGGQLGGGVCRRTG